MQTSIRKEGEYPFYPIKAENEVFKSIGFTTVADEESNQYRQIIDYSNNNNNEKV